MKAWKPGVSTLLDFGKEIKILAHLLRQRVGEVV